MEMAFRLSSLLVMPFWVLMIFVPRAKITGLALRTPVGPALPALLYLAVAAPRMGALLPALMRPELGSIGALLGSPEGTTLAWAHFLSFDLFVGRWAYLDSRERGVHPLLMAPILFLTLMFGPLGLLSYLGIRRAAARPAQAAGSAS